MKLSKKRKKISWKSQDTNIRRISLMLTAACLSALWLPLKKEQTVLTLFVLCAVSFTVVTLIWIVATALSKFANYSVPAVGFGWIAGFFWLSPSLIFKQLIDGWEIKTGGLAYFFFAEVAIAVMIVLVTAAFRSD